uniref:Bromo domain-containing protein n=1 Tax=Hucho hucho TaxID=62062 RepID=A0A4W5JRI5_9TELE
MDLSTVMTKIDTHKYLTAKNFLVDIDLICSNALEYNPDKEPSDKIIRHRACSLKDTAHAMLASELDPEFNRMCEEIKESRRKRDLQTPDVPPISLAAVVTTRKPAGEENAGSSTQGEAVEKHHCSSNHIKRKARRRPSWGRGIIRKKKNYKKGTEEEVPSDSCLTQDEESSCDTMDPQPNGHHTHPHTHGISTEEESSNEAPRGQITETETQGESNTRTGPKEDETPATDDKAKSTSTDKDPQSKSESSPSKSDESQCKNKEPQAQEKEIQSKDEELQSKDEGSQAESENPQAKPDDPKPKEEGFQPMDVEKVQPKDEEVLTTEQQSSAPMPAIAPPVPQEECVNGNESMDSLDSQALKSSETEGPTAVEGEGSEGEVEEVSASAVSRGTQDGRTGDTETGKEEQDREGWSKGRKCRMSQSEQSKTSTDGTEEPLQIPPTLVVDQQRLTEMEREVQNFITFL